MLIPKKITNLKKATLTIGLLIVVLAIFYVIYDHYFADSIRNKKLAKYVSDNKEIFKAPEVETDLKIDFLNSSKYINLKQYGILPVTYPRKGKSDPFVQFSRSSASASVETETIITSP